MYESPSQIRAKRQKWGWGIGAGGGSLLLAVSAGLQQISCDTVVCSSILFAGFALLGIGLPVAAISFFWPRSKATEDFLCRNAIADEIPSLLTFAEEEMGPVGMPTIQQLRELFDANNQIYFILEGVADDGTEKKYLAGCFTLIPLKQGTVRNLEAGDLHGAGIRPDHITKKNRTAKGLYVGIVVGANFSAKGATLKYLQIELDKLCKKNSISKVFTRPVTDDGLRLVRQKKFKNVINNGSPEMNLVCCKLWESGGVR